MRPKRILNELGVLSGGPLCAALAWGIFEAIASTCIGARLYGSG